MYKIDGDVQPVPWNIRNWIYFANCLLILLFFIFIVCSFCSGRSHPFVFCFYFMRTNTVDYSRWNFAFFISFWLTCAKCDFHSLIFFIRRCSFFSLPLVLRRARTQTGERYTTHELAKILNFSFGNSWTLSIVRDQSNQRCVHTKREQEKERKKVSETAQAVRRKNANKVTISKTDLFYTL